MKLNISNTRKKTENILATQQIALNGLSQDYVKKEVSKVAKQAAAFFTNPIGGLILDYLYAVTPESKFKSGERPVAFVSNKKLMRKVARDESTIQRALNNLAEAGLIAFYDSPTCKRYCDDKTGEAFGIDLTPSCELMGRHMAEIKNIQKAHAEKQKIKRTIKNKKRNLIRQIEKDILDAEKRGNQTKKEDLQEMLEQAKKINTGTSDYSTRLEVLQMLEDAYSALTQKEAKTIEKSTDGTAKTRGLDRKFAGLIYNTNLTPTYESCKNTSCGFSDWDAEETIDFEAVTDALRLLQMELETEFENWSDLVSYTKEFKTLVHLSEQGLQEGYAVHDRAYVALCLAVTAEMGFRDPDAIRNLGAYAFYLLRQDKAILQSHIYRLMSD